jgi:hypothetical protein
MREPIISEETQLKIVALFLIAYAVFLLAEAGKP